MDEPILNASFNATWKEAFEEVLPQRKLGITALCDMPLSDEDDEDEDSEREIPAAAKMGQPSKTEQKDI